MSNAYNNDNDIGICKSCIFVGYPDIMCICCSDRGVYYIFKSVVQKEPLFLVFGQGSAGTNRSALRFLYSSVSEGATCQSVASR